MSAFVEVTEVTGNHDDASRNVSRKSGIVSVQEESTTSVRQPLELAAANLAKKNESLYQRLQASGSLQSEIGVQNFVSEMDNAPSVLKEIVPIIQSLRVQEPKHFVLERRENPSGTPLNIQDIFGAVPRELWFIIVPSFVLLLAVLAWSQHFVAFLVTVGLCFLVTVVVNHLGGSEEVRTQAVINRQIGEQYQARAESSNRTTQYVVDRATVLHQQSLETVTKIVNIQAGIKNAEIQATKEMHGVDTEKDVTLKRLEETGLTERNRQLNEMNLQVANMDADVKKYAETVRKEIEAKNHEIQKAIRDNELKTNVTIKTLDTQATTAIATMKNNEALKKLETEAATEKARMEAQSRNKIEEERNVTERQAKELETKKQITQAEQQTKIREAEEETKRIECQEKEKTEREQCIIV